MDVTEVLQQSAATASTPWAVDSLALQLAVFSRRGVQGSLDESARMTEAWSWPERGEDFTYRVPCGSRVLEA
ncbi:hypothetical protein ACH40E_31560 [Streptomyces acidicola]|uniref:hypothetical protein n=1 Tax=Streptomyces acidicola TaxID=2596892 RepID=UPI00379B8257